MSGRFKQTSLRPMRALHPWAV